MSTPSMPSGSSGSGRPPGHAVRGWLERLSPRQRQYALLAAILAGGVGLLWLIFASTDHGPKDPNAKPAGTASSAVTNLGVMPPGQQVNPLDQ